MNTIIPKSYNIKILNEYLGISKSIAAKIIFSFTLNSNELEAIKNIIEVTWIDHLNAYIKYGESKIIDSIYIFPMLRNIISNMSMCHLFDHVECLSGKFLFNVYKIPISMMEIICCGLSNHAKNALMNEELKKFNKSHKDFNLFPVSFISDSYTNYMVDSEEDELNDDEETAHYIPPHKCEYKPHLNALPYMSCSGNLMNEDIVYSGTEYRICVYGQKGLKVIDPIICIMNEILPSISSLYV